MDEAEHSRGVFGTRRVPAYRDIQIFALILFSYYGALLVCSVLFYPYHTLLGIVLCFGVVVLCLFIYQTISRAFLLLLIPITVFLDIIPLLMVSGSDEPHPTLPNVGVGLPATVTLVIFNMLTLASSRKIREHAIAGEKPPGHKLAPYWLLRGPLLCVAFAFLAYTQIRLMCQVYL